MTEFQLSTDQLAEFQEQGYILVENLFDAEEVDLLLQIAKADRAMAGDAYDRKDASGAATRLALRNEVGDDIYSALVCSRRVVETMEKLLGGEIYHYHHKMMLKEPRVGGAWEWHQDYGYWYNFGCLYPHMGSCSIAVDEATRENGCLQVIPGSHHLGRINHATTGEQVGADMEHVEAALAKLPLEYAEMQPGTALFFHANLLHRSDQNRSERSRWSLIGCYNRRSNSPYKESRHPAYTPLDILPDARVKEVGRRQLAEMQATA